MRPMKEFDPVGRRPCTTVSTMEAQDHAANYEKYASPRADSVIECDGLLLDGWEPLAGRPRRESPGADRPSAPGRSTPFSTASNDVGVGARPFTDLH
jgi:hypothetical protein